MQKKGASYLPASMRLPIYASNILRFYAFWQNKFTEINFFFKKLDRESTCSILEHMGNDGKQHYHIKYYNLDAILAVGYRVNSRNATFFRRWATNVLTSENEVLINPCIKP